jgi:two-component system, response regulator PdtaR
MQWPCNHAFHAAVVILINHYYVKVFTMRVLVVEDDNMLADFLADALEEHGHEVAGISATVSEAVASVRRDHPEIAVIDAQLAHNDRGTDIAEQLASSDDLNGLGILYVSGNPEMVLREARFGHACRTKPYGLATLASALTIVRDLAAGKRVPAALPHGMQLLRSEMADLET